MNKLPEQGYAVITKIGCQYCDWLEDFLTDKGIEYEKFDILSFDDEEIEDLKKKLSFKTYPAFIKNRGLIGGYKEALRLLDKSVDN